MTQWRFETASENAVIIYVDGPISPASNRTLSALFSLLKERLAPIIIDLVPSYSSIQLVYNAHKINASDINKALLQLQKEPLPLLDVQSRRILHIPVCYDEFFGPDLSRMAKHARLEIDEVIKRHSQPIYHAYAIGFSPGFAYLGLVDSSIATPRLETPRPSVAKGSVAIADQQTAVYPSESPGGWNIIGRTPIDLFDITRPPYSLIQPNDGVRFIPINRNTFNQVLTGSVSWEIHQTNHD